MKRTIAFVLIVIICLGMLSCRKSNTDSDPCSLSSGTYYMVGEFEELMTPYLSLDFDDYTFSMGAGALVSFQAQGTFTVKGKSLVATTQISTFVFEITENNTLILVDNGDNEAFQMPENSEYVLHSEVS